ncbi:anaphase-promoting complex subunit 5-domain-containing protein [Ilyonectria robusta]|uniref:anaphase-promoting complex subunit 5-domain-containing protein n=1 Tax=Ilyonectria robusta TaxID=1079257 RepID=UPI001E8CF63D|nr:anaphase-promoting complex subunit 5-domain-containing protein [Ilyonectria robusta]KAH8651748.1 anaphase-promoting complex subunit 5-domain-containing protein [Ilyonectria robusta]
MARYLNPTKICLLVLTELYNEGAVPSDAVLPVLSFITSHLMDHPPAKATADQTARWNRAERTVSLVIAIKDFERLLGSYPFLMGMPGRKLWDQFLGKLWDINSLDALHEFFENLLDMLAKSKEERRRLVELGELEEEEEEEEGIKFSPNSPLGMFLRRARLEFQRLQFHDCTELWKNFVRYRQPTAHYLKRKIPGFGRLSFDNVLLQGEQEDWDHKGVMDLASVAYGDMLTGDQSSTLAVSTDDIEVLLEFQIEQMQKYGNRIPQEIAHQFHDLLNDSFLIPSLTHYLTFLDSWRAGDYPTAFDSLHRYFDYTMQNRDRMFYQYALMNLAVLQADFGCHKEAVSAMLESVSTARENRDLTCLNFALNWLFHFGRAHPELVRDLEADSMLGTGKDSLAFLRVKAKETGMWTLWSSALLSEAKLGLVNGDSVATALEFMVRSSQVIIERNMKSMFGSQLSLSAALWDRLGLSGLAFMTNEVFLRCYARHSIFDDELKVTSRISLMLAARGKYDEALGKMEALEENSLRSWKPSQYWHKYRGVIKLKRDLYHNNLEGAEQLLSQMMQSSMDDLDPDMAFHIDTLHIDCLTRRGDLQAAFAKVDSLMSRLGDEKKDVTLRVRLLVLKASLLDKCGRPQRGFTIAMRATSISWRARIIPALWHSTGALANILVSLAEFEAASQLLNAVIPRSLECEAPALTAQLYSHLADANMGLAGKHDAKSSTRKEYLTKALAAVQKSFDHYSSIEDINQQCQMMAKKAMIIKLSGDMVLAADYAAAYVALRKSAELLSLGGA